MKVYTVHPRSGGPAEDVEFVPEGFSWAAFWVGPIWPLCHGLWPLTILYGLAAGMIWMALDWLQLGRLFNATAILALQGLYALLAQDLRRWSLTQRGYEESDVVVAGDAGEAAMAYVQARAIPAKAPPQAERAAGATSATAGQALSPFASPFEPS